ncbi:MAG: LptF/LptG family permease [Akkermansiaceae bacterium]
MDRYIGRQILVATIFGVLMLSVLLLMGNLVRELRPLLVEERASPSLIVQFVLSVLPFSLIYTVPWGFLVAVLLVFGRVSAENELVSMRMAGVGLLRVAMPVFIIAGILSVVCLWLNVSLAPKAKDTMKFVLYEAVKKNPNALLDPGVVQTQFVGQKIFIEGRDGNLLQGLHLNQLNEEDPSEFPTSSIYAREAKLKVNQETKQLRLHLTDAYIESVRPDGTRDIGFIGEQEPLLFDFSVKRKKSRKANAMTNDEIEVMLAENTELEQGKRNSYRNEIHRRYSFSCACLALSLVGVPLGINTRRRETSTGLVMALGVGLGYFLLFMMASQFEKKPGILPAVLFWLPNVVCLCIGIYLFYKARSK